MRRITMAVAVVLASATWLTAQPLTEAQRLDIVLGYWQDVMSKVKALEATCVRVSKDKVFKTEESYQGKARFLKSDIPNQTSRASLELENVGNKAVFEKIVLTGPYLYEFRPSAKEIRVHDVPVPKAGEGIDHNLMSLLFGMKVEQAKKRYDISFKGEDENYFYLQIVPLFDRDKAEFSVARLALVKKTYLPRQLYFLQANGNDVRWDLPAININKEAAHLRAVDFQQPALPTREWKFVRVPAADGPTKVRSVSQ